MTPSMADTEQEQTYFVHCEYVSGVHKFPKKKELRREVTAPGIEAAIERTEQFVSSMTGYKRLISTTARPIDQ